MDMQKQGGPQALKKAGVVKGTMRRMSAALIGNIFGHDSEATFEDDHKAVTRAIRNYGRGIIHPRTAKWVQGWDAMSFFCLIYTAIVTPFEVGLLRPLDLDHLTADTGMLVLFCLNRVVDAFFLCDLVLNFYLAYQEPPHKGGMWVTQRSKIVRAYLRSWFLIDLFSCVPFDLLLRLFGPAENAAEERVRDASTESIGVSSDLELLRVARILRLLRLVKLLRILRASRILARWQNFIGISYAIMTMARFLTMTIFVVHFMACAWAYLGLNWEPSPGVTLEWETTWLIQYDFDALTSSRRLYVFSLYVAVCAMFGSVGSIQPANYAEFVLITAMMIIGSTVWAWVIGSLCGILATLNPHATQFQNLMDELNFFMRHNDFSSEHRVRLREFFRQMQEFSRVQTYDKLMLKMSAQLRGDTALRIAKANLEHIWYFTEIELEQEFLALVALNMHACVYEMREVMPTTDLTVIDRGVVARRLVMHTKGSVLGLDCVIPERHANLRPLEAAYSLTFVQSSTISRVTLFSITEHFPEAMKALHHAAAIYTMKSAFRLAWTAHKKALRSKGLAGARVSTMETHDGALKYTHASAVLAAFAGAGSVADSGQQFLDLSRGQKSDALNKFRRKPTSTVAKHLSFHTRNLTHAASSIGSVLDAKDISASKGAMACAPSPPQSSTESPGDGGESSDDDGDGDDDDETFGSGERIQYVLQQLTKHEKRRTKRLMDEQAQLRSDFTNAIGDLHSKLDSVLGAFGSAMERMQQQRKASNGLPGGAPPRGGATKSKTMDEKIAHMQASAQAKAQHKSSSMPVPRAATDTVDRIHETTDVERPHHRRAGTQQQLPSGHGGSRMPRVVPSPESEGIDDEPAPLASASVSIPHKEGRMEVGGRTIVRRRRDGRKATGKEGTAEANRADRPRADASPTAANGARVGGLVDVVAVDNGGRGLPRDSPERSAAASRAGRSNDLDA